MTKDFIEDGMTTDMIKKQVNYIREYLDKPGKASFDERVEFLKRECEFFVKRYPFLFDMTISKNFNYEHLNYFLKMRDKIIEDKMTPQEASEKVGTEWFKQHVDLSKCKKKNDS